MSKLAPKFAPLFGDFSLRNLTKGEVVHTPVYTATAGGLKLSIPSEKIPSTGNRRGTAFAYEPPGRSATLTITALSRHLYLQEQYMMGTSVVRPASSAPITVSIPALKAGQVFVFDVRNLTSVAIPGKVEGVDYELFPRTGQLGALADMVPSAAATVEHGAYDEVGIFNAEAQRFEIVYSSEDTGQSYVLYNGLLVPSGDFALVQQTGVGSGQLTFELSEVTTAVADAMLGKYGRAYNVD